MRRAISGGGRPVIKIRDFAEQIFYDFFFLLLIGGEHFRNFDRVSDETLHTRQIGFS